MSSKPRRPWKIGWLTQHNQPDEGTGREGSRALRVSANEFPHALTNPHNRKHPPGLFFIPPVGVELAGTHRADSGNVDTFGCHPTDFELSPVRRREIQMRR